MKRLALLLPLLALAPLAAGAAGFRLVEDEERAKLDEERAGDEPAVTVDGTVVATKNRFRFVADPTRSRNLGTVDFLLRWAPREPFVDEPSPFAWTVAGQYADDRFAAQCIADAFLLDREAEKRGFESGEAMVRDGLAEATEDELRAAWAAILAENPSEGRERRFEEVRDDLKADLSAKKLEDRIERLLEPLRKAAVIQYAPGYDPAKSPVLYWNPATRSSAAEKPHAESAEFAE